MSEEIKSRNKYRFEHASAAAACLSPEYCVFAEAGVGLMVQCRGNGNSGKGTDSVLRPECYMAVLEKHKSMSQPHSLP